MIYQIVICDDDAAQRAYWTEIITAWARKRRCLTEIKQYAEASSFLFEYEEAKNIDVLVLDVEMPGTNGIELAKAVRRDNSAVQIIFITGYYEYFSGAFDVSALHYLIKPVDASQLEPVLDKAVINLNSRQRCILISTSELDIKVPLADINYVEAEKVYVIVHTVRGTYRMRSSLAKFAEQLDETFFKVHRSFVVNLKDIAKIMRTNLVMTNGDIIPISRGMYDSVHAALVKYL